MLVFGSIVIGGRQWLYRRQARRGMVRLLTVYDPQGHAPLQQAIRVTDFPLGIALNPLRLVPRDTAGVPYLLGFPYPGAVPVLFCREQTGVAPLVLLDGDRLAQVTTDREAHDARARSDKR